MTDILVGIKFDNTLGALFVGFAASAVGFGIFTTQVWTYYGKYPGDKLAYKLLVLALWLLEAGHQALVGHTVYYYSVSNYLNPVPLLLGKPAWSLVIQLAVGALVGTVVKVAFCVRVWRFSYRNWPLTIFLLFLTLAQMGLAVTFTVEAFNIPSLEKLTDIRVVGSVDLGLAVANDVCIAAALCYYLQSMRRAHTRSTADSLINRLTLYAVNTGILTSACSLTTLVLYNLMPQNFIFIGFYFVLSKLYGISFLATMNTRQIIRGRGTDRQGGKTTSFRMVGQENTLGLPMQLPEYETTASKYSDTGSPTKSAMQIEVGVKTDVVHHYGDAW
ncbi:hypothetical protein CONPUDRAFT_82187 [Coniophora puteana RWD-64-598 SS2]|uniref:DUF6534 domain-containing protein n=1 Tax=Coniophora puteana (strain RWD-64-598) TaxID=741705 RepID=A0A5M3MPQ1_CONPW|nr:uncharacterized protein CONPUDRAFT_82187 [Coniophora puteana RWD-64-598 SS2]EIW81148.1 hypothetical protein CONPUDRAFT_82187 [Coniophora puteana RWD-64-598 SS2]